MVHQLFNDVMLFFVGQGILVEVPITALAQVKGHTSKFVFNLGALCGDLGRSKQLCVERLVGAQTILQADKALDIGGVGGIMDNSIKQFPNNYIVAVLIVWVFSKIPACVEDVNGSVMLNLILIQVVACPFHFVSRISLSWQNSGVWADHIGQWATGDRSIHGTELVTKGSKEVKDLIGTELGRISSSRVLSLVDFLLVGLKVSARGMSPISLISTRRKVITLKWR